MRPSRPRQRLPRLFVVLVSICLLGPVVGAAPSPEAGPAVAGVHHRFEVGPGIWSFVPRFGGSTATVIVGTDDVVVVDPHSTPAQARALAVEIRALTDAPVKWIVGSHWHGDHHGGAAALQAAWPGARLVEHPNTARDVFVRATAERPFVLASLVERKVAAAEELLERATDAAGRPLGDAARRQLAVYAAGERRTASGEEPIRYVEPDVEVEDRLVLWAAGRRIEIRHPGPAHTEGDLYVWLPDDRVLVAGDLLTSPYVVPRSGFPRAYAGALRHLDRLPFEWLVPGHGAPLRRGHERLRLLAGFLDAVADAVAGLDVDDSVAAAAAPRMDRERLTSEVLADPAVGGFQDRIDWDEPLAMRFLDFSSLVEMTAVRARSEALGGGVPTDFETGYVDVGGARLRYQVRGAGEPVVLVHGGYMDARMWDPQLEALALAGHRVVRYDLPGFGRTLRDDPDAPRSDSDDLAALLDALEIDRAHVVGLSLGGSIALDFAVAHPGRLRTLILAETRPSGMALPEGRLQEMRDIFRLAEASGRQAAVEALLAHPLFASARSRPEAAARIRTLVQSNFTTEHVARAEAPSAIDHLDEIGVPTLLIQGAPRGEDARRVARVLGEGIGDLETATIDGAGHVLNLERPEAFNRLVIEFLRRHVPES